MSIDIRVLNTTGNVKPGKCLCNGTLARKKIIILERGNPFTVSSNKTFCIHYIFFLICTSVHYKIIIYKYV